MSEERRRILDMLATGKISADDAERLLERISRTPGARETPPSAEASARARTDESSTGFLLVAEDEPRRALEKHRLKFLRIVVTSADEEKVNIRIPLAFVRTGLRFSTVLPPHAHERLLAKGVDLSTLSGLEGDELMDALRDLRIHVDGDDGETVRIFCV